MLDLRILDILELKLISVKMLPIFEHAAAAAGASVAAHSPTTFQVYPS